MMRPPSTVLALGLLIPCAAAAAPGDPQPLPRGAAGSASTAATPIFMETVVRDPEAVADLAQSRFESDAEVLLRDLVRIPTLAGDAAARRAFGDRLERAASEQQLSFERLDEDHVFLVGLDGRALAPDFWVLAHGDVVPVGDLAAWPAPPFAGEVRGDTLFGRGTLDDKGAVAAAFYALAALREGGAILTRKPLLVIGMDEETDWRGIEGLLAEREAPELALVVDGDFPLTIGERGYLDLALSAGGGGRAKLPRMSSLEGGSAANVVAAEASLVAQAREGRGEQLARDLERRAARLTGEGRGLSFEVTRRDEEVTLKMRGKAAHGSTPEAGRNAVAPLARIAIEAELVTGDWRRLLRVLAARVDARGAGLGIASTMPCLGATSVNLGTIETSGEELRAVLNIRPTNEWPLAALRARLRAALAPERAIAIETVGGEGFEAFASSARHPWIDILIETYREETGRDAEPGCIGGTTYAKAFTGTEALTVGFGPAEPALGEEAQYHADPEFISRRALSRNLRIYARAFAALATTPEGLERGATGRSPRR